MNQWASPRKAENGKLSPLKPMLNGDVLMNGDAGATSDIPTDSKRDPADTTGLTQFTDLAGMSQHTNSPDYTTTTLTQLSLQGSGHSAQLASLGSSTGSTAVDGKRDSIGVTQYTDMTGLSQYTEDSRAGLSEYTCSDMTGLTQHSVSSDASHLTQYSDTTGFLLNNTSDFKPLGRDSMDFENTASLSTRMGLRDSTNSNVSQASSVHRDSINGYDHSIKSSRESIDSEASVGKVVKQAGVEDYMSFGERQKLLDGANRAQEITDMRNIQRPSLEGAADDNVAPALDKRLSTGSKAGSTALTESERSSTDYNQLDLFAQVSDKQERLSHQSDVSSTDWNKVDLFASRDYSHQSSKNNSNRSSVDWSAERNEEASQVNTESGARPKVPSAALQNRRPDGGENGGVSLRSSQDSRSSSRGSGNGQDFDTEDKRSSKGSRPSSRNSQGDNVLQRPGSRSSIGNGRESLGSRSSERISKSQRSSLGSHGDTAGKISLGDLSIPKDSGRDSLELSVDPRREMCQTMDSADNEASLFSSGSQKSFNPSSIDKDDRLSVSSTSSVHSRVSASSAQSNTSHRSATSGHSRTSQGSTQGAAALPGRSSLMQDFNMDNKKYYSLAMVSTNSSLDVDDFVRQADRASTAASSRDVLSAGEGFDSQWEQQVPPHGSFELYSPAAGLNVSASAAVPTVTQQPTVSADDRRSGSGSQRSSVGSQRSSSTSQRSQDRKSLELAMNASETISQNRSLLLQPKPDDVNESRTESRTECRESPVSLDNTEELLRESNKHLPDKALDIGQDSDSELLSSHSLTLDQSGASDGRPSVGSAIRDVVRQSMSGRGEKIRRSDTSRARSEGAKSLPDIDDSRRKSMPDRVADMLAEAATSRVTENGAKYRSARSERSDKTLTPDPELLSNKSGRSGRSSKSGRSGVSSTERTLLDHIGDISGHTRVEEWRTQNFGAEGSESRTDGERKIHKDVDEMSAGRLTSTGSSTVYAELPQNLSANLVDLSTVREKPASDAGRARSPSNCSVRTEDTLDEDVRRILNKYSKVLTSSEDESEVQPSRKSPQGSAYDTDDSLGMRVSSLLNGENLRMDVRKNSAQGSTSTRSTTLSEHGASDRTDDLLKPISVNTDTDPSEALKKYSPGRVSASSSRGSTLKEGSTRSEEPMELPLVDPARERGVKPPPQQQAAEFPELEGIERMNPALNEDNTPRDRPTDQKKETGYANQVTSDSLMRALSDLGEGVDPEIMERIAKRVFAEQQLKQSAGSRDEEDAPLSQSQLADRSLDSLSHRVNLLLSERVSIGARIGRERSVGERSVGESSASSRRSSQTSGSINYDTLQRELDDIQSGLAALQSGDLSIKSLEANEDIAKVRESVDAIQSSLRDGRARTSDSEFSTPRKYSWDYGADLGADENMGQFISTRRNLTLSAERLAPEGKKREEGSPKSSPVQLRSKTPDILVTPASGSTRTSIDGDAASATSKSPASVISVSDAEQRSQSVPGLYDDDKHKDLNRSAVASKPPIRQHRDTRSGGSYPEGYSNRQVDRLLRQEQRDSGIVEHGGRISLRPQEDSGMGWDSRISRFSSSSSARDSGLGAKSRSYDDLHEKSAGAVAQPVELSTTRGSETSLTDRIADIMERESPQRQALEYLEEAEKSWVDMQRSKSELSLNITEDGRYKNTSLKDTSMTFSPSPVPQGPLSAFGNMKAFLATQLQKTSQANFDTSTELMSPVHHRLSTPEHRQPEVAERRQPEVEPRELPENRDYQFRSDGKKPVSTDLRETSGVKTMEAAPVRLPENKDHQLRRDLKQTERDQMKEADKSDKRVEDQPRSDSNVTMTTNSLVDAHTSRMSEMYDYYKYSSRIERPGDQVDRLSFGRYVEAQGLSPIQQDVERPDSAVSSSSRRSAGASPSLRPYRPAGSTEVYYVESGADDNASVTTMESTHADSDDAVGPHFPKHVLGTRTDPNVNSVGIYDNATGHYGNKLTLSRSASPPKQLDPIQEASFAENTRNNNNQRGKDKSDSASDKSSERGGSELSDSMNAETVIAKHNRSANNKSISSEEFAHDKSASSHDPSVKSQDGGNVLCDASVKSHELQDSTTPSGGELSVREPSHQAPSAAGLHDSLQGMNVSGHVDSADTEALFRSCERSFESEILDIKQYQGKDEYELRLRVREQEAIQAMIDKHKELLREREEEERRLRQRIRREIEEESAQRYNYQKDSSAQRKDESYKFQRDGNTQYQRDSHVQPIDESSVRIAHSSRGSDDKTMSGREFRTPERHVPDVTQSTSRSRSHDQRTESGYFDDRQSSSRGGKTSYEVNETQNVRGDRSSSRKLYLDESKSSAIRDDRSSSSKRYLDESMGTTNRDDRSSSRLHPEESKGASDEFYSQRRSPYGEAGAGLELRAASTRSPYIVDTGVTSESDRVHSDEFQPLQTEQDTDSSPDPPYTAVTDAPPIPQLPNKYQFRDGTTLDRGQIVPPKDALTGLNRSAKEPLERSVLDSYLHPTEIQAHRLSRSLDLKHVPRSDGPEYQSVRYRRDLELEKLQADIRRRREEVEQLKLQSLRREEVEQLKLQSLRHDGLPGNINSVWDRFNKVMSGADSTLSEASVDVSTASSSSIDMGRLKDLLKNPGKYLVKYLQENPQLGSSFTVPLEAHVDKKQRTVNFDSDLNERRHYDKDGFVDKKARRKQYERSREQYADTSTTSSQNLSSSDFMDVSSDASSTLTDTTLSSTQSNGSFANSKKRKYINGQDSDTLPSIPEDSTLESTTDVTMTTDSDSVRGQGHRDPKMLQLQQKIKRQKELHEKERRREYKRKDKIAKLEKLLAEKNGDSRRKSTSPKKTSTPSGTRYSSVLEGPPTPTMSEITSSSTMVGSSTMSDDTLVEELDSRGEFTRPEEDSESSACPCKSYQPVLTPKPTHLSGSGRKRSPDRPASMRLREVDYARREKSRESRGREVQRRSASETQIDKSAKDKKSYLPAVSSRKKSTSVSTATSPKRPHHTSTSVKKVSSPGKPAVRVVKEPSRYDKETKQHSNRTERERTFTQDENVRCSSSRRESRRDNSEPRRDRERSRSGKRERERSRSGKRGSRSRSGERRVANVSAQAQPTARDVSVNCPSPIMRSPPTRRKKQDVTMISEAVQTSFHKRSCPRHGTVSGTVKKSSVKHPAGAFTPETSDLSAENQAPASYRDRAHRERGKAKAGQSGFAWYIPLGEPRPWRKPLRERQAYAGAVDTAARYNRERLLSGEQPEKPVRPDEFLEKSPYCDPDSKPSLQDAFSQKKMEFISRSRERQRIITLKAMERKMQELHNLERVQLFAGEPRRVHAQGWDPHPIVEGLFKPKKRVMSRREMKELNAKVYRRLPEVTQAVVEKRRQQEYQTNRVRAQMFKQKVLNRLLYKKAAWVQ